MSLRSPTVFNWFAPGYVPPGTSIEAAGLVAPEMQMTNVSTVVGYLNYMQDAIGSGANDGSDIFSSYGTEIGLAATPDQLVDRINLLLMAGEMDSTLYGQILGAVSAIPIPTGDQNAINAALADRVQDGNLPHDGLAIFQRAVLGAHHDLMNKFEQIPPAVSENGFHGHRWRAFTPAPLSSDSTPWPRWPREPAHRTIARWSASSCRAATMATAPSSPPTPDSFAAFTQARSGAPGLAYPIGQLLPITLEYSAERPHLCSQSALTGVQNLFNAGRAAIVANTGTLIAPATKAQVNANSVPLPASLFSHFDQTAAWQAIASNGGSAEHVGWGGAVADLIESMNMNSNSMFTCISTAGIALFLAGQTSFQLNVTSAGPIPISGLAQPLFGSAGRLRCAYIHPLRRRDQPLRQGVRSRR